jgi:regulatory protein
VAEDKQGAKNPYSTALRMLARRAYSVAELRRALERKFPNGPAIDEAIARLRTLGYLNDKRFAEHYAASLARNRSFGRFRVRRELKSKLVDYRHIETAIAQAYDETDERELLARTLDRKIRTLKLPVTPAKLNSLCQSLLRRGFAADAIIKAVRARPELRATSGEIDASQLEQTTGES